jgi:hypothetical protein
MARVAFGDDVCFYVAPTWPCQVLDYATAVAPRAARIGLGRALDRAGVGVLYADPALAATPQVARLIVHPAGRWRVARSGRDEGRGWAVLVRG